MHVKPFYILILLLCFVFFTISAANPYDDYSSDISSLSESHIPPLWQEEPHFIYYRILLVNEKINRLEQTIDNIGDKAYRPKAILFYVEDARELIKMMRMILGICDTTGCLE